MEQVEAKCMLCGKVYQLGEDDKDFKKVAEKKAADPSKPGTFICDLCANKIRYESDDKKKHPKPSSN
ncbi:MAG: DUF2197 domain-containing protein [Syntrophomonadaceae bacterium]